MIKIAKDLNKLELEAHQTTISIRFKMQNKKIATEQIVYPLPIKGLTIFNLQHDNSTLVTLVFNKRSMW